MNVIVFGDGTVVGPYEQEAQTILDRYLAACGGAGYVTRLIPPGEAQLTVEDVLRNL